MPPADPATIPALDPEEGTPRLLAHLRTQVDGLDEREAARRSPRGSAPTRRAG